MKTLKLILKISLYLLIFYIVMIISNMILSSRKFDPILNGGNISAGEPTYIIQKGTNLLTPVVAEQVIRGEFK